MTFEAAVEVILSLEKGYVNDPEDPGGETNFGISKRQYPGYDIKGLTKPEAIALYHEDYWQPLKPLLLPPRIRLCLFDCAVNQGVGQAIRFLQQAVGTKVDGVLGPYTLSLMQRMDEAALFEAIMQRRLAHYAKLSTFPRFGVGWMNRILTVTVAAFK